MKLFANAVKLFTNNTLPPDVKNVALHEHLDMLAMNRVHCQFLTAVLSFLRFLSRFCQGHSFNCIACLRFVNCYSILCLCLQLAVKCWLIFISNVHGLLSFRRVQMFSGNRCAISPPREEGNVQPVRAWKIWTAVNDASAF